METPLLKRINELAAIAKTRPLTPEELEERQRLRGEYLGAFRKNLTAQLDRVYFVDEKGNETKLKKKDEE